MMKLLKNSRFYQNVYIIHPEDTINSYCIIDKSSFCIVYASTIANEIAAMGKPLIIGGEAYIKNKGITYDPISKDQYFNFIDKLINNPVLNEEINLRAKNMLIILFSKNIL